MKARTFIAATFAIALVSAAVAWIWQLAKPSSPSVQPGPVEIGQTQPLAPAVPASRPAAKANAATENIASEIPSAANPPAAVQPVETKLERLDRIRETFRKLAAEPKSAIAAVKELTDEAEREAAMLSLVSVWRNGELNPPQMRAALIAEYGLETGLGLELAKNPELALLWASELTKGTTIQERVGAEFVANTNAAAALVLADQMPSRERRQYLDSIISEWALHDTDAALAWADQVEDPAERDADHLAIRQVAPVGIGTQLQITGGEAVISGLLPGTPAESSGLIHPGDRIVGVAQGDGVFLNARGLPLQDLVQAIRGERGTMVQLQLLSADSPPDSAPRTVTILRDQIRHKQ